MATVNRILSSVKADLPCDPLARSASLFFTGFVLTLVVSVAATQIFLSLAGVCTFAYLLRTRPRIAFPPVKLPLALFCVFTIVPVFFAETPAAGAFEVRKLTLFLILLFAVNLVESSRHLLFLLRGLFVTSALAGVLAVGQFVRQYREVRLQHPHRFYFFMTVSRIHGFVGNWMNFGGQQMLVFLMIGGFLLLGWRATAAPANHPLVSSFEMRGAAGGVVRRTAVEWVCGGIIALSILLNFTRSVWLGCFAGAVYVVARRRARWLWTLPVLVALILVAGPSLVRHRAESVLHPERDPSAAIRLEMWRVGLRMVERHPLVGVGPDNIPEAYDLYLPPGEAPIAGYHGHLHNDFVQLAAERGLPCLAAWVWFMVALIAATVRCARKLRKFRWVAHGAIAASLALVTEGFFEFNFGSTPVLMVFLFLAALPFAVERIERLEETRPAAL